jgi:hypothetical protein
LTKTRALLILVVGIWLGGSAVLGAVASYNFAGFADLFARNPRLAEHAGFDPADPGAKKSSLLWVHSSELNRVYFSAWNRAQLILGTLAVALGLAARARRLAVALLVTALAVAALAHFALEPQLVALGRGLDFVPRSPPPAELAPFLRLHGFYSGAELVRLALLVLASAFLVVEGPAQAPRSE